MSETESSTNAFLERAERVKAAREEAQTNAFPESLLSKPSLEDKDIFPYLRNNQVFNGIPFSVTKGKFGGEEIISQIHVGEGLISQAEFHDLMSSKLEDGALKETLLGLKEVEESDEYKKMISFLKSLGGVMDDTNMKNIATVPEILSRFEESHVYGHKDSDGRYSEEIQASGFSDSDCNRVGRFAHQTTQVLETFYDSEVGKKARESLQHNGLLPRLHYRDREMAQLMSSELGEDSNSGAIRAVYKLYNKLKPPS